MAGFQNPFQTVASAGQGINYLSGEGKYADRKKFPFPRLVLLDHCLPGNGWQLLQWVREHADLAQLPVIILTGSEDPKHQQRAIELGANAYHIKPQDFQQFVRLIGGIGSRWLEGRIP